MVKVSMLHDTIEVKENTIKKGFMWILGCDLKLFPPLRLWELLQTMI